MRTALPASVRTARRVWPRARPLRKVGRRPLRYPLRPKSHPGARRTKGAPRRRGDAVSYFLPLYDVATRLAADRPVADEPSELVSLITADFGVEGDVKFAMESSNDTGGPQHMPDVWRSASTGRNRAAEDQTHHPRHREASSGNQRRRIARNRVGGRSFRRSRRSQGSARSRQSTEHSARPAQDHGSLARRRLPNSSECEQMKARLDSDRTEWAETACTYCLGLKPLDGQTCWHDAATIPASPMPAHRLSSSKVATEDVPTATSCGPVV